LIKRNTEENRVFITGLKTEAKAEVANEVKQFGVGLFLFKTNTAP
jgi:hypothetical protein